MFHGWRHPAPLALAAAAVVGLATGCSSSRRNAAADSEPGAAEPPATPVASSPVAPGGGSAPVAGPPSTPPPALLEATAERSGDSSGPDAEPPEPTAEAEAAGRGSRPSWWLPAPHLEDGRVTVSSEALGRDVLDARRSAIEAGRDALRRSGAPGLREETITFATVRPVAAAAASKTGARYIGYVLISAEAEE